MKYPIMSQGNSACLSPEGWTLEEVFWLRPESWIMRTELFLKALCQGSLAICAYAPQREVERCWKANVKMVAFDTDKTGQGRSSKFCFFFKFVCSFEMGLLSLCSQGTLEGVTILLLHPLKCWDLVIWWVTKPRLVRKCQADTSTSSEVIISQL